MPADEEPEGHGELLRSLITDATGPQERVLLEEAARIADRLDAMDAVIRGRGVLDLLRFRLRDDEGRVAEVRFDNVMAEARQQAATLRQILATLGVTKIGAARSAGAGAGGSIVDELARRRAEREAGA